MTMASSWTVVQQSYEGVLRGGTLVPGVEITVQLGDGSQIVVDVDSTQYQTLATVKGVIQAAVDLHDSVSALTG